MHRHLCRVISSIIGLAFNGSTPFPAEVYFINLANTIQMKFAVPYFDVFDSKLQEFSVPVAVRGSFDFNICDYQTFINKHRLDNFSVSDLQVQVKDSVSENVKIVVANAPDDFEIPVIHLGKKITDIKEKVKTLLAGKLFNDYGITLKDINLAAIEIDKDSSGYKELSAITKDLTAETLKKRNKANIIAESREIKGNQTLGMFEKAANALVDIKENQFIRHKKAEVEFADAIEDARAGKIGAIRGKLFRDIGKMVHGNEKKNAGDVPPPIPTASLYNVAVDGKPTGPYTIEVLAQMVESTQLTRDSLVWKKGMAQWEKAGDVDELKDLFIEMPPIPE
ncbi:MAG: DUF4339 domain-containing protein [Butyrivibrio sp.]|nr:DUF4339 domain-containing protein [Butyrivibrio sp.]